MPGKMGLVAKKGTKNATDGEWGLCAEFAWNPKGNSFYFEEAKHVLHGRSFFTTRNNMSHCGQGKEVNMKKITCILYIAILLVILCLATNPQVCWAQNNPNTITFDNQSGEPALVKVIGHTGLLIEVPNGESRLINVPAGQYYLLVRYGSKPDRYTYAKGDPFTVTQTETQYSVITITLHKVVGGNYSSHPISSEQFENVPVVWQNVDRPEAIKTLTPVLPPPTIQLPPPAIHLPPPTIQLPPPTIQLPSPTIYLPPPTIQLPPPAIHLPPPTIQLPSPKEIEEKKEEKAK
jgi:hypothetical protein